MKGFYSSFKELCVTEPYCRGVGAAYVFFALCLITYAFVAREISSDLANERIGGQLMQRKFRIQPYKKVKKGRRNLQRVLSQARDITSDACEKRQG